MSNTSYTTMFPPITSLPLPDDSICKLFENEFNSVFLSNNEPVMQIPNPTPLKASHNSVKSKSDENRAKGPWTTAEDKLLLDAMASYSGHICWEELSKMIPGRSAKQCRERWQFRLHPDVNKAPFEPWEDEIIIRDRTKTSANWSFIAHKLPGRTSCAVKNRWYTVLRNRKNDQSSRKAKVCPIQVTPFFMEAIMLRNRKELWEKGRYKHHEF
ncbi:Myb-like DNA-binding domain containing protein [Tritrichomonas foetus]|uniref:Myb-like DNA-binding domain containing protein n=1 Tax=Tritrichomonas foetus TaxID=1144522 RepID=A0A1J4JEY4_9EUKA|nr:Myb-like DNA-binding domain containing protein [Tritrichomonas foetus]|eukprot:OHS96203.1 Myb-like DNA-binding domain containing protein [Tritrichomonas foetus]